MTMIQKRNDNNTEKNDNNTEGMTQRFLGLYCLR